MRWRCAGAVCFINLRGCAVTVHVYETTYNGYEDCSEEALRDRCRGLVWSEIPTTEQSILSHSRYQFTENGVGVWYCYGGDYYWFTDELNEEV